MDDLTSRYLDSFATIEKHLRRMLDANRSATFNELLGRAVSRDRSVRRLRDQLKDPRGASELSCPRVQERSAARRTRANRPSYASRSSGMNCYRR